jgi:protein gp37
MKHGSEIAWTHIPGYKGETLNPTVGCSKVSEGCKHCYAEELHRTLLSGRFGYAVFKAWTKLNAKWNVKMLDHRVEQPMRWRKPRAIFVNSMSDLFHEKVTDAFIADFFDMTTYCPQHIFIILTKRPDRMCKLMTRLHPEPLPNVWLGTSVENDKWIKRVDYLRLTPAVVHFLSIEPLLGRITKLHLHGIEWVIAGGESGRHISIPHEQHRFLVDPQTKQPRPDRIDWIRDIRNLCSASGVPFFFKQWGGRTPKACGRELDGRTWDEFPNTNK